MKDLSEAQLIEMESRARTLALLASEYRSDMIRNSWNKETREDKRFEIEEGAEGVVADVETLCEHLRAHVSFRCER